MGACVREREPVGGVLEGCLSENIKVMANKNRAGVLTGGDIAPRGHLALSEDIFDGCTGGRCCWHLVGRAGGCC